MISETYTRLRDPFLEFADLPALLALGVREAIELLPTMAIISATNIRSFSRTDDNAHGFLPMRRFLAVF